MFPVCKDKMVWARNYVGKIWYMAMGILCIQIFRTYVLYTSPCICFKVQNYGSYSLKVILKHVSAWEKQIFYESQPIIFQNMPLKRCKFLYRSTQHLNQIEKIDESKSNSGKNKETSCDSTGKEKKNKCELEGSEEGSTSLSDKEEKSCRKEESNLITNTSWNSRFRTSRSKLLRRQLQRKRKRWKDH